MTRNFIPEIKLISDGPYVAVPVKPKRGAHDPCDGCWYCRRGVCCNPIPDSCVTRHGERFYRYVRRKVGDILVDSKGTTYAVSEVDKGVVSAVVADVPVRNGRKHMDRVVLEGMDANASAFRDVACELCTDANMSSWSNCRIFGFAIAPTGRPGAYRGRLFCRVAKDSSRAPRLAVSLWAESCVDEMERRWRDRPAIAVDKKTFAVSRKSSVDGTVEVSFTWSYTENGIPR